MKINNKFIFFLILITLILGDMQIVAEEAPEFVHTRHFEDFKIVDSFKSVFFTTLEQDINAIHPNVGGEVYTSFTFPEEILEQLSDDELDKILYRALLSFSTQKGISYYSYRRNAYRLFLEESYRIKSLTDNSKIEDESKFNDAQIELAKDYFIYQEDSSFGKGIRKVTTRYNKSAHQFYIKIVNEDPIKYKGLISVAKREQFRLGLLINRNGNKIDCYGVLVTRANTLKSLRDRISYSIVYRILSVAKWYEHRVLELLAK